MDNANTKQKLIIQIVCLLLSIGLWFYVTNIENPLRTITLNKVPVKLVNVDSLVGSKLVLLPNQELYVALRIEGLSQEIRKIDKNDFEIQVDLSEYALKSGLNKIFVNIIDYPTNITVKNSNNLFVNIYTENLVQKDINITSSIDIIANSSHYIEEPVFTPEKVKINGPESLVSKVDKVIAIGTEENLSETISKSYKIQPVDINGDVVEGVTLSDNIVNGVIKVSKGIIVPLKINTTGNIKDDLKLISLKLSKQEVEIVGPMDKIQQITEISTESIDLSNIKEDTTLDVELNIPEGVKINLGDEKLSLVVDVDKKVSKELNIAFEVVGLKPGLEITVKNESVRFKISGFESEISKLNENNFKAKLDVSKSLEAGNYKDKPIIEIIDSDVKPNIEVLEDVDYDISLTEE